MAKTITGTLDGGEHVVTMRFPVSETEFIEGLNGGASRYLGRENLPMVWRFEASEPRVHKRTNCLIT